MSIDRATWGTCREDYIRGRGSLAAVSKKHGLKKATVEKCAKREGWTQLRHEFEAAQMAKLIPPPPPVLPPAPVAPDGAVSEQWLMARQEIHYQKNSALLDKTRDLLDAKLTASEKPSADELGKLTSALSGLVSAEIALLGLNRRQKRKQFRRHSFYDDTPFLQPTPVSSVGDAEGNAQQ